MDVIEYQHSKLIQTIKRNGYKSLVDIGCGNGDKACFFAKKLNMRVLAIDEFEGHGSESTYEAIEQKIKDLGLNHFVRLKKMDAKDLGALSEKFDIVFAQNSLHHIFPYPLSSSQEVFDFFRMLFDVLSPNGIVYINEVGRFNFWDRLSRIVPGNWYNKGSMFRTIRSVHFYDKTPYDIWLKLLSKTGFKAIDFQFFVPYPFRVLKPLLNNRLANLFLESNYMIMAQKQ